ncbi:L-glyceraldehyde 3-phosphate reductase [Verrucomicrobiaceae bacterium 5K15]|uniref:L-glyceraldehyde 3-phosphate reductase n=1 Tax=Oceaniferula flava TaxID=2800421 RepID=A0AAE2VDS2_9BACT|nr:L-glyceraldehyde 3-phosphate reductase [Oceaniferula flavus]MBK1854939.1 L-glyceraldehyde 3-phosphate reductase [Oceaniferula flavus]MBM1136245.1 L-glyceraldehyde 3-phosphate reductase [Oceaniferula flavus]
MSYTPDPQRYDGRMPYRRCGNSGLKLPAISLGFWHNFGDVNDLKEASSIMHRAFDLGITHFDFANNYGPPPGSAERNCGKILQEDFHAHRDELVISSKAGYHMWDGPYGEWGSRKYLLSSLDQSLDRLQLDYVDIFYSHRPDPDTPLEETMGALATAVQQGKALYVGISNYPAEMAAEAMDLLQQMGTRCLIHQPRYNLFDRWIEEGLTDLLQERGVGCIPFSPLAQGLLTGRYLDGIPANSRAEKDHGFLQKEAVEEKHQQVRALQAIADQRGQTLAHMALAWVLRLPTVTSALIGASSVKQLEENVRCLDLLDFTDEELQAIDHAVAL